MAEKRNLVIIGNGMSGARTVEVGQQGAAWIGRDPADRVGARAETESMQRQRRFRLGI